MWHFISDEIAKNIEREFICDDIREITSGHTHKAFKITDGRLRFFVKINENAQLANFKAEIEGLEHLQKTQLFKIPNVICSGLISDKAFLVLEFLTLTQGNNNNWDQFGQALANQHKLHTQDMYGWQEDNFIGMSPQVNQWHKKWNTFFAEQRIGFMLQLLAEKGHSLTNNIDQVVESVNRLLAGYNPVSSMLHGDLWSGNTGFHKDKPVLFDPAFYYGDREADIAMTELFSRLPDEFYQGYQDVWPLCDAYQFRKPVYQLYHVLNHALLFGGSYLESARSTLKNMEI
ncbi:fructosamine kinase family protein [Paraglaciecola sp.]|uniref:fructosamine kinase family protein n=1 Tax=Paraglaciecola sp. TaxID=1920173 RepID=UPI0030F3B2A1